MKKMVPYVPSGIGRESAVLSPNGRIGQDGRQDTKGSAIKMYALREHSSTRMTLLGMVPLRCEMSHAHVVVAP